MKNTLKVTTPSDREIVMTRTFDAPRHLVFEAMTKPELIKRWLFLPPGWSMTTCEEDVRVGGKFRWEWAGPDGKTAMTMSGVYSEVVPPERIARTEKFEMGCNTEVGEQQAKIVLTEQGGKTLLTLTVLCPNKEARDGMIASGMEQGVSAGYDKLDEMLAAGVK
jgi:uncharacterized protein YndB with AHSA1/START domain